MNTWLILVIVFECSAYHFTLLGVICNRLNPSPKSNLSVIIEISKIKSNWFLLVTFDFLFHGKLKLS